MTESDSTEIGLVSPTPGTDPNDSGHVDTRMLVSYMLHYHSSITIITRATADMDFEEPNVDVVYVDKPLSGSSALLRLIGHFIYQVRYSIIVAKRSRKLDMILVGGSGFVIPMMISKILGIFVIYKLGGAVHKQREVNNWIDYSWVSILKIAQLFTYTVTDLIISLSDELNHFADASSFHKKTVVWNYYYLDLEKFNVMERFDDRDCIGHIGVSKVKGTIQFLKSLSLIEKNIQSDILIIGDGDKMREARAMADSLELNVEFTGKISRDKMPQMYNRMRVLVITSRSEGVPKAMFESFACGTPVCTTSVGGTSDHVTDGSNGFLVNDDTPSEISDIILRATTHQELLVISENSRRYAKAKVGYQNQARRYANIINNHTPYSVHSDHINATPQVAEQ